MANISNFDSRKGILKELKRADVPIKIKLPFTAIGWESELNPFEGFAVKQKDGTDFQCGILKSSK